MLQNIFNYSLLLEKISTLNLSSFLLKCAKQEKGNNLCGYYVYEYTHALVQQINSDRDLEVRKNYSYIMSPFPIDFIYLYLNFFSNDRLFT